MDGELIMIIESDTDIKLELQKVATTMVKLLCDTVEGDNYFGYITVAGIEFAINLKKRTNFKPNDTYYYKAIAYLIVGKKCVLSIPIKLGKF